MAEYQINNIYSLTLKNAESTEQEYFQLVKYDSDGFKICTTSDIPYGVLLRSMIDVGEDIVRVKDGTHTPGYVKNGEYGVVMQLGKCKVKIGSGDSVTAGSAIMPSATNNGCVTTFAAGGVCIGYALETSSTAGYVDAFINITQPAAETASSYLTAATAATTYEKITTLTDYSADGAVTIPSTVAHHLVTISKAGVCALTIADPTATTHDGMRITFISETANAHTLDNSGGSSFNGATGTLTMRAAIGNSLTIYADGGVWYVDEDAVNIAGTYLSQATAATTYQELCGYQELTDDGAVTAQTGLCHLNKGSAIAATLVAPPSAGLRLEITSETAQAHTVAAAAPGIGGGGANTATFGGAAYDTITLVSWDNGGTLQWEIASKTGVTVA